MIMIRKSALKRRETATSYLIIVVGLEPSRMKRGQSKFLLRNRKVSGEENRDREAPWHMPACSVLFKHKLHCCDFLFSVCLLASQNLFSSRQFALELRVSFFSTPSTRGFSQLYRSLIFHDRQATDRGTTGRIWYTAKPRGFSLPNRSK